MSNIIITNTEDNIQFSNNSSTTDLLTITKEEWDSGHESNSALNTFSLNKVNIFNTFNYKIFFNFYSINYKSNFFIG